MRINFNLLNKLNEGGYTLLESIIQLSVLLLFSQLFTLTIGLLFKAEDYVTNPIDTEWALFIRDVESYLNDVEILTIQREDIGVRFRKGEEEFDIELYQDLIRKQKNRLGHEQMLLRVKSISTTLDGPFLRFSVEFTNGVKKEHTFYVTYREK
ncbi:competence type IV pilus minor pilin ComGF [Psychrobacillus sp.]|uniref:competence type IV pilus minor pilin ComGF n=1 Tax=Psychrobacillus sp. TaxID=1871623 RepID=UPI0028BD40C8|nr:competence type IV pilus minor pilin ComGF [Psychrobacillus sp.]